MERGRDVSLRGGLGDGEGEGGTYQDYRLGSVIRCFHLGVR